MIPTKQSATLALKLACIVVHAEEATSAHGHAFDVAAIRPLLTDPEVGAWLDSFDQVLLPIKRKPTEATA